MWLLKTHSHTSNGLVMEPGTPEEKQLNETQTLQQGDVLVHQDIGCALRGDLIGTDGEHVGPTTEAIGEQQDVGVASWCDREGAEVVNTDSDTRAFR